MKVKVCGITSVEQLQQLQQVGIDYAGIILYKGSKRYAGEKLEGQEQLIRAARIAKVGVFVNEALQAVQQAVKEYGLTAVQLHGDESAQYCRTLMEHTTVIKVFRLQDTPAIDDLVQPFLDAAHYFLFDTETKGYGGSGKKFNWQLLLQAGVGKPFFLSGGIGPEDAEQVKEFSHPFFYGVDVNSRFETEPGWKDMEAVRNFVTELGAENAQ